MKKQILGTLAISIAVSLYAFTNASIDTNNAVFYYNLEDNGQLKKSIPSGMTCGGVSNYHCSYLFTNPNNIPKNSLPEFLDVNETAFGVSIPVGSLSLNE